MRGRQWWIGGLLAALAVAMLLSPWASPWPDGLDRVSERLGFRDQERRQPLVSAPLAHYRLSVAPRAPWSTSLAGAAGTLAVFGGTCLLGYLLTRRRGEG